MDNVGKRLSEIRKELNMTQEELADKMNVKRQIINYYENNVRKFKLADVIKLSEILGCSCDYLLGRTNVKFSTIDNSIIHRKLGLSEESISSLETLKSIIDNDTENKKQEAINFLNIINFLIDDTFSTTSRNKVLSTIAFFLSTDFQKWLKERKFTPEYISNSPFGDDNSIGYHNAETLSNAVLLQINYKLLELKKEFEPKS